MTVQESLNSLSGAASGFWQTVKAVAAVEPPQAPSSNAARPPSGDLGLRAQRKDDDDYLEEEMTKRAPVPVKSQNPGPKKEEKEEDMPPPLVVDNDEQWVCFVLFQFFVFVE